MLTSLPQTWRGQVDKWVAEANEPWAWSSAEG